MRTALSYVASVLLAEAEFLLGWVVGSVVAIVLMDQGVGFWAASVPALAAWGGAIFIADNVIAPGKGRPLTHVTREYADRVADWGGLEYADDDPRA